MGKYFGTDGFRGEANEELTAEHAYKVGRFLGWYFTERKKREGDGSRAKIVIGKDTRRSGYMFEYALVGRACGFGGGRLSAGTLRRPLRWRTSCGRRISTAGS